MSKYICQKSSLRSKESIVAALIDMGVSQSDIEMYSTPVMLEGYLGQDSLQTQGQSVVVRRRVVDRVLSRGMSNDLAFEQQQDGTFQTLVSDYDNYWWDAKRSRFMRVAAAEEIRRAALAQGKYSVAVEDNGETIALTLQTIC
jgi:hypothetical protein